MSFKGNVTVVLGKGLAAALGKKGTASDVTLYNFKLNDVVLSFVEPSSYPDKVQSLVSSMNMADQALLKVEALDSSLAESIVALDALGLSRGYVIYGDSVNQEAVKPLLAGTLVSSYEVLEDQPMAVKERLASLDLAAAGSAVVQIDHSFPVKGVGTVALGVVKRGVVKKHDNLLIYPGKKRVLVKSLQVHDVDMDDATTGLRVGLALKDIKPEDVPRGSILAADESIKVVRELDAEARVSKYSPRPLKEDDQVIVNSSLNYVPAKVVSGSVPAGGTGRVRLALEKELTLFSGRVALLEPGQKMPRVFGHCLL
jgi:selenocysteine-specific translation elongation factor